jgi:hypothetical protein
MREATLKIFNCPQFCPQRLIKYQKQLSVAHDQSNVGYLSMGWMAIRKI